MELKYDSAECDEVVLLSSNRTFMELKYVKPNGIWDIRLVLIVPLWNWNGNSVKKYFVWCTCSNRTFMELKSQYEILRNKREWSSNRTFMELK